MSDRGRRKGNWQMRLSVLKKIRLFFIKNGLKISRLGDILLFRSGGACNAGPAVELLASVISAKLCENQPSFLSFFAPEIEMPAQEDCIFVSCWAFLYASREQVLAGPSHNAYGKRPAFFVLGRRLVRRNDTHPPEVAMLLFDCPHSHQIHPVGDSFIRRPLLYSLDRFPKVAKRFLASLPLSISRESADYLSNTPVIAPCAYVALHNGFIFSHA